MTKRLRKQIMIRSKLRNKINESRTSINLQNYKKQRNKCIKVLRNAKQQHLNSLNSKSITDTNKFWKAVKPLLSNWSKTTNTIILRKNNRLIKDNQKILHTLNKWPENEQICMPQNPDFYKIVPKAADLILAGAVDL